MSMLYLTCKQGKPKRKGTTMTNENTFKNVSRVTENYDGSFIGCGWYAHKYATTTHNAFGREDYREHTAIEYLRHAEDMTEDEDYTDFIGDYSFAVAETESNSDYVLSIYFANDYDEIEDALTAEYLDNLRDNDPDATEDEAREWARMGMVDIDKYGSIHGQQVKCEGYDVTFIK